MKLGEIAASFDDEQEMPDICVTGVTEDSRAVRPGMIFVAVKGEKSDGHAYIDAAVRAGAVAVVGEQGCGDACPVPYIAVPRPRAAAGEIAHGLAGYPSRDMCVIGVTGTNGKSSIVTLVAHILRECGVNAAAIGTLGYEVGGVLHNAPHTTPFGPDLANLFKIARDAGQTHLVMEVSSHALSQERVAGIEFTVGAFTNLTQDHFDYHGDMADYRAAKLKLFERIQGAKKFTVVNIDDPSGPIFQAASRTLCHTYGSQGDCRARDVTMKGGRSRFTVKTPWGSAPVETRLLGLHNVSNVLCATAICGGLGMPLPDVCAAIGTLPSVPGRFESVDAGQEFQVIVDYAHTDDGLRNVLEAARAICTGRVITVFGCGGDRDRTKRPKMAAVSAALSDYSIVTSDNPRTEDPQRIIEEVVAGMKQCGKTEGAHFAIIADRATAIAEAVSMARPGDLVMIAGKGHEDYQILGAERIHFDDREVARAVLEQE